MAMMTMLYIRAGHHGHKICHWLLVTCSWGIN